ncbi:trypsin-like peptidase domain-containing protein [Kribbella sp. NPDC004138]
MASSPTGPAGDRVVKVRADLGTAAQPGPYRHSTGFVVREGVVLTTAHGVAGARTITVTDLQRASFEVVVTQDTVLSGDPAGPSPTKGPDLAIVRVPGLGVGRHRFPIARLNRHTRQLRTLAEVQVAGFPTFKDSGGRRHPFHDQGTLSLLSSADSGLVDVTLSAQPPELIGEPDVRSQWSGISGAPLIVDGRLIALVTEHSAKTGRSVLAATPVTMIDPTPEWPGWGPGVPGARAWWDVLAVDDPARLPVIPAPRAGAVWIDDLHALADELVAFHPRLPAHLTDRGAFAVQAHQALCAVFDEFGAPDFVRMAADLPAATRDPAIAPGTAVYNLSTAAVLTEQSLVTALEQLFSVHLVATTRLPGATVSRLRYRLSAPSVDIADLPGQLVAWVRSTADPILAQGVVTRIEISTEQDPFGHLFAGLSNSEWTTAAPGPTIKALTRLLLSPPEGDLAKALEVCFDNASPRAGTMLQANDVEPAELEQQTNGFLVNEQPTLNHLRHGYFAPASDLDEIEQAYWQWYRAEVMDVTHRRSGSLPTFWITGPSGAGKSILLLQLLARLNCRAGVSVLLPDSVGEHLSTAVEQVLPESRQRHIVIGVDDPLTSYGGRQAWRTAFDMMSRRRQTSSPTSLPVFICCAPSEQYDLFRSLHAGELIMERYVVDPYRQEFTDHLRQWYEDRTGSVVPRDGADGVLLPAQLFFEWWKGEGTRAFARRFRERIESRNLPALNDFFDRLLAVNRLYVGYPSAALRMLPPESMDALSAFLLDLHVDRPALTRPGYWLSHPHLANLIYEEWFPAEAYHDQRGAHLTAALLDAIGADPAGTASLPLLEQVLTYLNPVAAPLGYDRVEPGQVRGALRTAASSVQPERLSNQSLSLWVRIEQQDRRCVTDWSPLIEAISRLNGLTSNEFGLPALLATLVEVRAAEADQAVWNYLERNTSHRGWLAVAQSVVGRPATLQHTKVLVEVVEQHLDDDDATLLLASAVSSCPADQLVVGLAQQVVVEGLCGDPSLAMLSAALFGIGGASRDIALAWLRSAVRPCNGIVFAEALRLGMLPLDLWKNLEAWFTTHPTETGSEVAVIALLTWPRLSRPPMQKALAQHLRRDPSVDPQIVEKLATLYQAAVPAWSFGYTPLPPRYVRVAELRAAALRWLSRNRDSIAWSRVYVHLCLGTNRADPELYAVGHRQVWLMTDATSAGHTMSVLFLVGSEAELADLSPRAAAWMLEHWSEVAGWGQMAIPVMRSASEDQAAVLAPEFTRWALENPDSQSASYVNRAALNATLPTGSRARVTADVISWLSEPRLGWAHVFLDLFPHVDQGRAAEIALPWLMTKFTDVRWAAVFAAVVEVLDDADVAELARAWFAAQTGADSTAGFLWRVVLEEGPNRELLHDPAFRGGVNAWLLGNARQRSWWHIWLETHSAEPTDMDTVAAALRADMRKDRSFGVANALARSAEQYPELVDALWETMAAAPRDAPAWLPTWLDLATQSPTEHAWQLGLQRMNADIEPAEFSYLWRRSWNIFPERHPALRPLARRWLTVHADNEMAGTVAAKLAADDSVRVTPASVFGPSRRPAASTVQPLAPKATVSPTTAGDRQVWTAFSTLTCPRCGESIPPRVTDGRQVLLHVCVECLAELSIDLTTGEITSLGRYQLNETEPISIKKSRAIVHCTGCGRYLITFIRTSAGQLAVDNECRVVHQVSSADLNALRSTR